MRVLLLPLLPLSGLLLAPPCLAQGQFSARMPPARNDWSTRPGTPTGATVAFIKPAKPVGFRPDTMAQRLLVQHRVSAITKLQLNQQGQVKDTISRYAVDAAGNVAPNSSAGESYADQHYTTLMPNAPQTVYYSPGQPVPVVMPVRPNSRDDLPATTLAQALRTQDGPPSDSLRRKPGKYPNPVPGMPTLIRPTATFTPHPDTTLYLRYEGPDNGSLQLISVTYLLQRQGRPTEMGELALHRVRKASNTAERRLDQAQQYAAARRVLRDGRGREVLHRWVYSQRQLLMREEINTRLLVTQMNGAMPQVLNTVVQYTYNNLRQLIARTETVSAVQIPARTTFTTYSYSPQGLLVGESTNSNSSKPVFYRYQYAFRN